MTVRTETREQAFAMYCKGIKQEVIAQKLRFNRTCIPRWKTKFKWDEKKQDILDLAEENALYSHKEQEDMIIDAYLRDSLKQANAGELKIDPKFIVEFIKLRSVRRGEVTERTEVKGQTREEAYQEFLKKQKEEEVKQNGGER